MANIRYTNLPQEDLSQNVSDETKTKVFFNGYFDQEINISPAEWDIVYGFFLKVTKSEEAAQAMSEAVVTTAINADINPIDLIHDFQGFDEISIDTVLAMYLNDNRMNTSLLGVTQNLITNVYVGRNILA